MSNGSEPANKPRSVTITVAGATFKVQTDVSLEYVERLQRYVNDKIKEVQPPGQTLNSKNALVLAALAIADDYFTARAQKEELEARFRDRLKGLLRRLDETLATSENPAKD